MIVKGFNKAILTEKLSWSNYARNYSAVKNRPCVFLSHKSEDKPACRAIGKYLKEANIDIFLDEEDEDLQRAVRVKNDLQVTECIKKGIRESTHMLCVISLKTYTSVWVPFEIGYGHAAIIDKAMAIASIDLAIKLSVLTLDDISKKPLPEYMHVAYIIRGTESLNTYISSITNTPKTKLFSDGLIVEAKYKHPLDGTLNYEL